MQQQRNSGSNRRRVNNRPPQSRPNSRNKIVKFNNVVKINGALIACAVIFLYVVISILISTHKKTIATYRVDASNINNNITCSGVALRNEVLVTTSKSGYACYYARDGEKVRKGSTVCTIDETGAILDSLSSKEVGTEVFTDDDYKDIRNTISLYKTSYTDDSFFDVYNFKASIDSKVLELSNEILMQQISQSSDTIKSSLENIKTPESGIITYFLDGYESVTPQTITPEQFDKSSYEKSTIKTGEIINSGSTVFKMIEDENWNIVCQITADQAALLTEEKKVRFSINNSNYTISAPFELIQQENGYLINISISKYMTDYISERFVNIEIILDQYEGLKIPNTAITTKQVYKVPIGFVSQGGNSSSNNKVNIQAAGEDGQTTVKVVELNIYKSDEEFLYVDPDSFEATDVLVELDTNNTIGVSLLTTDNITGVYIANKGITDFVQVNISKAGDEFSIITDGERLKEYDNIIMNANEVTENVIIY